MAPGRIASDPRVAGIETSAYTIPTDRPETDGTFAWDSTTLVVAAVHAAGASGIGYTYGAAAAAAVIRDVLADAVAGADPMSPEAAWQAMVRAVRNIGRPGIASHAIAAVDTALWDLKARLLDLPLATLLGRVRDAVPVYGSGGFTSQSDPEMVEQLAGWAEAGIRSVKMKVGRDWRADLERVGLARDALGPDVGLFVDANGAYDRKLALAQMEAFAADGVSWFEEPVSSDDLDGLTFLRDRAPGGLAIAAGEYGYDLEYFQRMLEAGAVDVLQADATRCAGITGFLRAGALCEAFGLGLSAHTAPSLHLAPCCAAPAVRHLEYFHDHVRIETAFFEGTPALAGGALAPDLSTAGLGLTFKTADAERYRVF